MKNVILYINQFFAGIGGEGEADYQPAIMEGAVGPGLAIASQLKNAQITHTIVCGDNFMNSNHTEAIKRIDNFLKDKEFHLLLAGPAFQSGRYGMSCGAMCTYVSENYNIPVVTSMNIENPGVDAYRENPSIYIVKGNKSAAKMRTDVDVMVNLANKLINDEEILWAEKEGYFGHGIRREVFVEKTASDRAVDMLLDKIAGRPYETEYKIEIHDSVPPAKAIADVKKAKIAIINTGGLVPVGNPDHMPSGTASIWKAYPIDKINAFLSGEYYSIHGGFSTDLVNADPEALVPLKTIKDMCINGAFKELEPFLYTTTGNLTALKDARRMGQEIAQDFKDKHIDGAILVSTWGSCTRCGATMVKEIEKAGFPTAHITNMTPVAKVTGSNRIITGIAITNPCSDVRLPMDDQLKIRKDLISRSLKALGTDILEPTFF